MSNLQNSHMITVALGATIGVIGAAGVFIYQKLMEQREKEKMMSNLENVNKRVSELQVELDILRAQQNQQNSKKSKKHNRKRLTSVNSFHTSAETDNEIDAVSVAETEMDDDFYDCSDDEISAADLEMNGFVPIHKEKALRKPLDVEAY